MINPENLCGLCFNIWEHLVPKWWCACTLQPMIGTAVFLNFFATNLKMPQMCHLIPVLSYFSICFPTVILFWSLVPPTFLHSYAGQSAMIPLLVADIVSLADINKVTRGDTKMPTVSAAWGALFDGARPSLHLPEAAAQGRAGGSLWRAVTAGRPGSRFWRRWWGRRRSCDDARRPR